MVTRNQFSTLEMRKASPYFSALKTIVETAFYENQVISIKTLEEAYQLASNAAGTVILDMPVIHTKELGLPSYARVLLTNSGAVVGRTAKARRIYGLDSDEDERLLSIVRSAVYQAHSRKFYKADAIVGLDEEFMVRAHLMVPEEEINNLYSWLLNFQILDEEFKNRLKVSKRYDEDDIFVFFDPKWSHPDYPDGLAYFDTNHNCVAILGLNYFGELKKATLTLAWGTAARNGYVSCHGGLKIFQGKEEKNDYVASFFGLSGSGKSTILKAINGEIPISKGRIFYDNIDSKNMNFKDLHENISYVSLEDHIFNESILFNLTLGREIEDSKIEKALEIFYLRDWINGLSHGLETTLSEISQDISSGQKQRISLARAYLEEKPILIIDEATDAIDKERRYQIEKHLFSMTEKTVIFVSHHLDENIRSLFDKIIYLD